MPYPDDLDDTTCTLAGLYLYDNDLFGGDDLAKIITGLTTVEHQEGGPYYTWYADEAADPVWKDVDCIVNSNINYLLHLWEVEVPNVHQYIDECIATSNFTSQYYVDNPLYGIYAIARWYNGEHKEVLRSAILEYVHKNTNLNDMARAMAVSSLFYLEYPSDAQKVMGDMEKWSMERIWQPHPYVVEYKAIAGSAALTAAVVFEALCLQADTFSTPTRTDKSHAEESVKRIYHQTQQLLTNNSPQLEQSIISTLGSLQHKDAPLHEIALLASYTANSVPSTSNTEISDTILERLGVLNILGWMAYSIYDDIVDEQHQTDLLPLANIAIRECTRQANLVNEILPGFQDRLHQVLNKSDQALQWERVNCYGDPTKKSFSLPHYNNGEQLADRSFGHVLGALGVIELLGHNTESRVYAEASAFFKHYLIARQLLDDMHDWEDDLSMQYINSVAVEILQDWHNVDLHAQRWYPSSGETSQQLQHIFWFNTAPTVCATINSHLNQARQALNSLTESEQTPLHTIIDRLQQATSTTISERKSSLEFLESYHQAELAWMQKKPLLKGFLQSKYTPQ